MPWFLMQIIGIICGAIGMILTWIITIMPQWRLSVLAEHNGLTGGRIDGYWISRWDGLWTTCVSNGRMALQCGPYETMVSLTTDLKAGRVLMSCSVTLAVIAFIFSLVGFFLWRCNEEDRPMKHCLLLSSGVMYIISAAIIIIPVSWTTSNIVRQAYAAEVCKGALRIELGEALFLAWPTLVFLLIAGGIMCWYHCRCKCDPCDDYALPPENQADCTSSVPEHPIRCSSRSEYI
ncbi:claudin-8-like [Hyperolius riggenbachi]|uniref:claudin-8-like n=1 Tax=Hyperolius riggenbachi TaxID=752182 RepID=UPI0035A327A7